MRTVIIAGLLLGACGQPPDAPNPAVVPQGARAGAVANDWSAAVDNAGATLVFHDASGAPAIRLACPRSGAKLSVNVPSFDPVGSEERLTFGSGRQAVTLVADSQGDGRLGGVTGEGAVPANLGELLSGAVWVNYGSQNAAAAAPPAEHLVRLLAGVCSGNAPSPVIITPANSRGAPMRRGASEVGACLKTPAGEPVPANSIKAVGTEPFWAATVEGRCVTYSHPEDQSGARVWTTFSGTSANGTWTGSLGGQPFVMRTRPQAGCSDGMSDKRYPIAVALSVGGEQRNGCAEPR